MSETPDPSLRPRVAVVFGGRSSEHAISCVTAGSVLRSIDPADFEVIPVGIAPDGRWVLESADPTRLAIGEAGELPEVDGTRDQVTVFGSGDRGELHVHRPGEIPETLGEVDLVFPLLHGPFGEDGTIQGLLEMAGARYVGSGVLASAVGMDKHFMKVVLAAHGLPILPYAVVSPRDWERDQAACIEAVESLGYPVFVKPCRGGSSIGISKVSDRSELAEAIAEAQRYDPKVIVEAGAAPGSREIECGVLDGLGGADPQASVAAEIVVDPARDFYDFEAKYLPGDTGVVVPADLSEEVAERIQELSVASFEALACEGLARVDFFLEPGGRLVVNEVNTMPGFTPTSMFPRMWAESGVDYPELIDRLLRLALERPVGLR